MPKEVTVLGLEETALRAIKLVEGGKTYKIARSASWPLVPASPQADDAEAPVGETADAAAEESADPLFEALTAAVKEFGTHEFVVAVPLSKLLVTTLSVPVSEREGLTAKAEAALKAISPFPDEVYRVGVEEMLETDATLVATAATLPDAVSLDWGDAFEAAKARVIRTDASALGYLRTLWPRLIESGTTGRRLVLLHLNGTWDFVIIDDAAPVILRGLGPVSDAAAFSREVMLGVIRAETTLGGRDIAEVVVVTPPDRPLADDLAARLAAFGPVRTVALGEDDLFAGVLGVAYRSLEEPTLDVTPVAWDTALKEARFKKRLVTALSVAGGVWALAMAVLIGVPLVFGWMTDREKQASRRHQKSYQAVRDMRDRVRLVQRYSDHARGALETLKAFTDRMPEGVLLTQFTYRRGEDVKVAAECDRPTDAYAYKDALTKAEDEAGNRVYTDVTLSEVKQSRGGGNRFEVDAKFPADEEAAETAQKKGGR